MDEGRPSRKKRHGRGRIYKTVSVVIILALIIISVSIFFRVETIEVSGAEMCDPASVVAASGLEKGDSMIFLKSSAAVNGVFRSSPYIKEVSIKRSLPSTVIIAIVESLPIASVRIGDSYWLLDSTGKLLEKTVSGMEGTITVKGVSPRAPAEGEKISLGEAEKAKRDYLVSLLGLIYENELYDGITYIDMSNATDVVFDYLGRFRVRLGQDDELSGKISMLRGVVAQLGEYDSGEINLSAAHEAHFVPS